MNWNDLPPDAAKLAPGALGSLAAMLWIRDTWPRKLAMFFSGAAASWFGAADVARWVGLSEGFAGFLMGLFGMAITASLFDAWKHAEIGTLVRDWLRKRAGLS